MSTLPGGRLAPQPPVTRVAAGGVAFLVASVFAFMWAGIGTMVVLTEEQVGVQMLHRVLRDPYQDAVASALRSQQGSPISVDADLVNFTIERRQAADINIGDVLARNRAQELYDGGLPEDPGVNRRTDAIFPRSVLTLFTEHRHNSLKTAQTAALLGMATCFLLCAVIGLSATRFLLPGAAAAMGWVLLDYHVRLVNFWVEENQPGGLLLRGQVRTSSYEPGRNLLFIAITLLVAGVVFRALRGPVKAILRTEPDPAPAPAGEPQS